jgi:hypothetical protein
VFVCFVDIGGIVDHQYLINIREYRKGQSKQDNPKKQDEKNQTKTQHNMCWTTLCTNKHK